MAGLDACLKLDADIIVNLDGDNQYNSEDIEKLIEPILSGRSELVIGTRPINSITHFSFLKKKRKFILIQITPIFYRQEFAVYQVMGNGPNIIWRRLFN